MAWSFRRVSGEISWGRLGFLVEVFEEGGGWVVVPVRSGMCVREARFLVLSKNVIGD